MRKFISDSGLFKPFLLLEITSRKDLRFMDGFDFDNVTFDYYCPHEQSSKTFALEIEPGYAAHFGRQPVGTILKHHLIDGKLDYNILLFGRCKSCHRTEVSFAFNVYSDKLLEDFPIKIFVQKIGCIPQIKISPDPLITKHFSREVGRWYHRGINAINENYGIGAFAYFRRIIEAELINIIEEIQKLPDANSVEIQKLLDQHNESPKVSTIYENIFQYLPNSLKVLGNNPVILLYKQTSEGLHSLSEDECLERSRNILQLLNFVIRKINEENSEIRQMKETIKRLS